MVHNSKEVLEYWNRPEVESMYDKHLINLEINLIKSWLKPDSKILDAGCGEGEGTLIYSDIKGVKIDGADFSEVRLKKAVRNTSGRRNVSLHKIDFLGDYELDKDYDFIISQRFLINLLDWDLQKKVITRLFDYLKKGGRFLIMEGSKDGVTELNRFRNIFGLQPIEVKWHNQFFDDAKLEDFFSKSGFRIIEKNGMGEYFLLTRGIRPYFEKDLSWDNEFNLIASRIDLKELLNLKDRFSRIKLWVVEK